MNTSFHFTSNWSSLPSSQIRWECRVKTIFVPMYSIHRHNILTIKEGRVSRDVVGANVYTSIDTGNTKTATTTCQYNDKYQSDML